MATKIPDYKQMILDGIKAHENQGYTIILSNVYDPAHSIFQSDRNKKACVNISFCNACEHCDAYKKNLCAECSIGFLANGVCPHSKHYRLEGPTKRSKSYMTFVREAKDALNISDDRFRVRLDSIKSTIKIGGDYVFLNLPHLANYVNPIADELGLINRNYIPIDRFTDDVIKLLLNYRPQAVMGGEIEGYQKTNIPEFILDLKHNFPEIYKRVIEETPYEARITNYNYKGKIALLNTLKPGVVKSIYGSNLWNWDGKVLKPMDDTFTISGMEFDSVIPKSDTYVVVEDNSTVVEGKTKFKN